MINASLSLDTFIDQGTPSTIDGSNAFLIDETNTLWFVRQGIVDLFIVSKDTPFLSYRTYFGSISQHQLIMGITPPLSQSVTLLAVPNGDVHLSTHTQTTFFEALDHNTYQELLLGPLQHWLFTLTKGITAPITIKPHMDFHLTPGTPLMVVEGDSLNSKKHLSWCLIHEGSALYSGIELLASNTEGMAIPLTQSSWLSAVETCTLYPYSTKDLIKAQCLTASLTHFYQLLFKCLDWNNSLKTVDELNLLTDKQHRHERYNQLALASLANSMGVGKTLDFTYQDNPLMDTFNLVGRFIGLSYVATLTQENTTSDPLGSVLSQSGARSREVYLHTGWWHTHRTCPLIGYTLENNRPIALIPKGSHMIAIDPVTRQTRRVTDAFCSTINPFAHMIYKPLSNDPIQSLTALFKHNPYRHKTSLWTTLWLGILTGLLALVLPLILIHLFDSSIPFNDSLQIGHYTLLIVGIGLANACLLIARNLSFSSLIFRLEAFLQPALWDRFLKLPLNDLSVYLKGDIVQKVLSFHRIRYSLTSHFIHCSLNTIFSWFLIGLLLYIDWKTACFVGMTILGLTGLVIGSQVAYNSLRTTIRHHENNLSGFILELISGFERLKLFNAEIRAFSHWATDFQDIQKLQHRGSLKLSFITNSIHLTPMIGLLSLLISLSITNHHLSAPVFIGFYVILVTLFRYYCDFFHQLPTWLNLYHDCQEALQLLGIQTERHQKTTTSLVLKGAIEFSHLQFRYHIKAPLLFNDLTFTISSGDMVAFVGPSGCGKSTLFRLLLGFETPTSGAIYLDGHSLSRLDHCHVRQQIGACLQSSRLLPGTIFSNIVGTLPLTLDDAWQAAEAAGIAEDISQMPMHMDTVVSEDGKAFSAGQQQRLLLARALITKPRLLVLDEATSHMDNYSQSRAMASLEALDITRLISAHRLSTITKADYIFVLDQGRIVQKGTFESLSDQEGLFKTLIQRQLIY